MGTGLLASLKWRLFFTIPRIFIHSLYDSSRTASPVVLTLLLRCSTLSTGHFCPVFQQPALFLAFFSLPGTSYWSHPRCCPQPNSQGSCFESCSCFWVSPLQAGLQMLRRSHLVNPVGKWLSVLTCCCTASVEHAVYIFQPFLSCLYLFV